MYENVYLQMNWKRIFKMPKIGALLWHDTDFLWIYTKFAIPYSLSLQVMV